MLAFERSGTSRGGEDRSPGLEFDGLWSFARRRAEEGIVPRGAFGFTCAALVIDGRGRAKNGGRKPAAWTVDLAGKWVLQIVTNDGGTGRASQISNRRVLDQKSRRGQQGELGAGACRRAGPDPCVHGGSCVGGGSIAADELQRAIRCGVLQESSVGKSLAKLGLQANCR